MALPFLTFLLKPGRWFGLLLASFVVMWLWRHTVIISLAETPIYLRVISAYQLPGSFDMFGLGMLAAVIHVNRTRLPGWLTGFLRHDAAAFLGILLLTVAVYWLAGNRQFYWADYPIFYLWTPLLSFGTVLLILVGMGGNRITKALFVNRPMVFAGLVSYSYYLWHFPVLEWLGAGLGEVATGSFARLLLISLPTVLLISTISYLAVERPGMRLR
jgi:peptidoglycan/LPS O-acetylase OafA/YrhL